MSLVLRRVETSRGKHAVELRRTADCTAFVVERFTSGKGVSSAVRMTEEAASTEFERVIADDAQYASIHYTVTKVPKP